MNILRDMPIKNIYKLQLISIIALIFVICLVWTYIAQSADIVYSEIERTSGTRVAIYIGHLQKINNMTGLFLWSVFILTASVGLLLYIFIGKNMVARPLNMFINNFERITKGDLKADYAAAFYSSKNEIGRLFGTASTMTDVMRDMVQRISSTTGELSKSSDELSGTVDIIKSSQQQLRQVEQIASSISDMQQNIVDVGRSASLALHATRQTSDSAVKGNDVVERAVSAMLGISDTINESSKTIDELGRGSQEIGAIVSVINDIAEQTNLLALNAAIEAARAGEQGRGFAVVADEVRKLAERTGRATKEIAEKIKTIQDMAGHSVQTMQNSRKEVVNGVELAQGASDSLKEIVEASRNSMDMVQTIASKTQQQMAIADEITYNIENVSSIMHKTSEVNGQIQRKAGDLSRISSELQGLVGWFKI